MSKRDDIKRIWQDSFSGTREYVRMYFDQVYRDDEALLLKDDEGVPVSSLLLQGYEMSFHGSYPRVSFIAGAGTRRNQRGKGYMTRLMRMALMEAALRGDMLCALIPPREPLFYFYRRYGFSTVFYTKEQRFTAFHPFNVTGEYHHYKDTESPLVWEAFDRFQRERECYILHTENDFHNILSHLKCVGGDFVVMSQPVHGDDGEDRDDIVSMAWAEMRNDLLLVTDVMGISEDARTAAMRQLRALHGGTPVLLYGRPTDTTGGRLMPRGMSRVVNAEAALSIIASAYPEFKTTIRITDPILPEVNSHTYIIGGGECVISDRKDDKLDLDVNIDVFTDILFSAPSTGEILRFPSVRPMISLMLD